MKNRFPLIALIACACGSSPESVNDPFGPGEHPGVIKFYSDSINISQVPEMAIVGQAITITVWDVG